MRTLPYEEWSELSHAHKASANALTAEHLARRRAGTKHPVEDFLFTYYDTRPAVLARWHPGAGLSLEPGPDGPAPHAAWRWYSTDPSGLVRLDVDGYLADRGETVRFVHRLLAATASRPTFTGCFGMHEWAMVYRAGERRHPVPLRLGPDGTDQVVESHSVVCSHFDAFRFFTPDAVSLNRLLPTRAAQVDLEQPGCLHASMDCHKWATKLGPAVPGELALDCFRLAKDCRLLDMQASPYDLSAYGVRPVCIETPEGKAEYVSRQREVSKRAADVRARLIGVCQVLGV